MSSNASAIATTAAAVASSRYCLNTECVELLKQPREYVHQWLASFDTVLTDCDGVLWVHNTPIEDSPAVINRLIELGKQVFFVTNNSTKTRTEFAAKATQLQFNVAEPNIVSTAYLAAKHLQQLNFTGKVYVIGSTGITRELDAIGIRHCGSGPDVLNVPYLDTVDGRWQPDPEVGAVIVGFDEHISFPKLYKAGTYLERTDCLFIATNTDERFPVPAGVVPGTGAIVRAVETVAGRPPLIVGKPNPVVCAALRVDHNIVPERTLMVGDRCNTDILLGTNCGFQTLLVGTGIHKLDDVNGWLASGTTDERRLVPGNYLPKLGDLLGYLRE